MPSLRPVRVGGRRQASGSELTMRGIRAGDGAPLVRRDAPLDAHRQPGGQRHVAVAGDERDVARRAVDEIDDTAGAAGVVEERERRRLVAPEDVGREIADVRPHRAPQPRQRVARDQVRAAGQRRPGAERRDRRRADADPVHVDTVRGARPVPPAPTPARSRPAALGHRGQQLEDVEQAVAIAAIHRHRQQRGEHEDARPRFIARSSSRYRSRWSAAQRDQVNAAARSGPAARSRAAAARVGEQRGHRLGDRRRVERIAGQRRVAGDFGQRRAVRRHDRTAAGHGLEDGQSEALVERGVDEDGGRRQQRRQVVVRHLAEQAESVAEAVTRRRGFERRPVLVGSARNDQRHRPAAAPDAGHRLDHAREVLVRHRVADIADVALGQARSGRGRRRSAASGCGRKTASTPRCVTTMRSAGTRASASTSRAVACEIVDRRDRPAAARGRTGARTRPGAARTAPGGAAARGRSRSRRAAALAIGGTSK